MWIETKSGRLPKLYNPPTRCQIYVFQAGSSYEVNLRFTDEEYANGLASFKTFEDALAEFNRIAAALKAGQNYYKIGENNG